MSGSNFNLSINVCFSSNTTLHSLSHGRKSKLPWPEYFFWKREFVCVFVWWREAKKKKGVVFWDPPDICVSSNVELPLVYFLSMQTNPKIGLLQCSASGNDNSTCIKQLPLSQFYLLLLYFSINPLFVQTNACHPTEWQYMLNVLPW